MDDKRIDEITNEIFAEIVGEDDTGDKEKKVQVEKKISKPVEEKKIPKMKTPEEEYYDYVEDFLKEEMGCFVTWQKTGNLYVGYVDVLGVKDISGEYLSDFEFIAVEVKLSKKTFARSLGQARGYSHFAHKCYLAVPSFEPDDGFSSLHKDMAGRLGVGLIEIDTKRECKEVMAPEFHVPINKLVKPFVHLAKLWLKSKGR